VDLGAFVAALSATAMGDDGFSAENPDWGGVARVFGGVAVAQALTAAAGTVEDPATLHSLHGYFLREARPGSEGHLQVTRLREGRSFAVRAVVAEVDGRETFRAICSFHRPETGEEYQLAVPDVPGPEQAVHLEVTDSPWPLVVLDLGASPVDADGTYPATRRAWFRTRGPLPDDPLAHLAVAAFVSDMTGSSFRPTSLGVFGEHTDASLDHALWFHRPLRMDQWMLYDIQALVNGGGRATVRGLMFDRQGRLCASMAQELLIRRLATAREVGPAERA